MGDTRSVLQLECLSHPEVQRPDSGLPVGCEGGRLNAVVDACGDGEGVHNLGAVPEVEQLHVRLGQESLQTHVHLQFHKTRLSCSSTF